MIGNELRYFDLEEKDLPLAQKFALEEFDPPHHIPDNFFKLKFRRLRIFTRLGIWVGYLDVSLEPTVWPAFSKRTRPRDVAEVMSHMNGWVVEQFGGGSVAVPLNTISFPEHTMDRLGYHRTHTEIYRPYL